MAFHHDQGNSADASWLSPDPRGARPTVARKHLPISINAVLLVVMNRCPFPRHRRAGARFHRADKAGGGGGAAITPHLAGPNLLTRHEISAQTALPLPRRWEPLAFLHRRPGPASPPFLPFHQTDRSLAAACPGPGSSQLIPLSRPDSHLPASGKRGDRGGGGVGGGGRRFPFSKFSTI